MRKDSSLKLTFCRQVLHFVNGAVRYYLVLDAGIIWLFFSLSTWLDNLLEKIASFNLKNYKNQLKTEQVTIKVKGYDMKQESDVVL